MLALFDKVDLRLMISVVQIEHKIRALDEVPYPKWGFGPF